MTFDEGYEIISSPHCATVSTTCRINAIALLNYLEESGFYLNMVYTNSFDGIVVGFNYAKACGEMNSRSKLCVINDVFF